MAAAQLNHSIDLNANSQHSVKAMLIQKHLNELEKYNQNRNQDENASVEEIDVDSPSDSGCEESKNNHWHSANKRSHSPTHDSENDSEPYCKLPRMIDVETVDPNEKPVIQPVEQTPNRNVFSIRNLIYTKDTSDSESAESEDSGNVNSSTGGNSPNSSNNEAAWRPDPDMLHRLKAELVQTLHTFVDTVVSDVVAKVASTNAYQGQSQKKKKKKFNRKTSNDSSNDSSNSSSTGHVTTSEKSFSNSEPKQFTPYEPAKIVTKFEPGANHQPVAPLTQSTQPTVNHLATSQRGMSPMPNSIHTFNPLNRPQVNPIRPSPHHTVALQQQAALNAVRQNPLFLQREQTRGLYPYLSSQNYPYGSGAPVNALLQQQDYRRSFLHIDPITGRIKNEDDYDHSLFGGAPQEGLTPHHLKKAKLMFFYCRYPSSNVLKTYFPDVKFNRATTSQLIKWFSNFREFFYIQIEKYARQALSEGIQDPAELRVNRDSDMFKALNNHYNKTNEFEVPDEFLECSLSSLREFFVNIKEGRDADPSWKKAIYKIICKSDTEIPESFKSATFLTDVAH